jgi:cell wall-associated NlpC family hydrolase
MGPETRAGILAEALSWYGTPYHHKGCCIKGVGVDCGRYPFEVFKGYYKLPPFPRAYAEDWANHTDRELYLEYLDKIAKRVEVAKDATLTMFKFGRCFSHAAIYLGDKKYIHCWGKAGRGGVIISPLSWFALKGTRSLRSHHHYEIEDQWSYQS